MLTNTSQSQRTIPKLTHQQRSLDRRLAMVFWALLLILVGTIWLFPLGRLPDGTLLVGIGVILLGLNGLRVINGIPIRVLPTILGLLALAAGLAQGVGAELPLVPLSLIAIGASILLELFPARRE